MSQTKADGKKSTGTQLLDRAVAILKHLSDHGNEGVSATQLAKMLDLNASTAHRIIMGLERHGLIEKENSTKLYRLSLSFFAMGAQAINDTGYRKLCKPILLEIAAATGDTVFLMARSGFNSICIDRQDGGYIIDSLTGRVGGQIPLGVGPASQSILAFMDEKEVTAILKANAPQYSFYNELSAEEIQANLPQIRKQGYAFDHGRLVEGISAIAIPIRLKDREAIGSISINMTSARLKDDRLVELIELLTKKAESIEMRINPLDFPAIPTSSGQQIYS